MPWTHILPCVALLMLSACGAPPAAQSPAPAASEVASPSTESSAAASPSAQASAASSPSTEASAAASPSAQASAAAAASGDAEAELTGAVWQWVNLADPVQDVAIENPANYTLSFAPDGTLAIKADCNSAGATYTADADGTLTIAVGPSTLVACPPGSRGTEFLEQLNAVARYFFDGDRLMLELMADGGTLAFEPQ